MKPTGNNSAAVELIVRVSLKYHGISFFRSVAVFDIFVM